MTSDAALSSGRAGCSFGPLAGGVGMPAVGAWRMARISLASSIVVMSKTRNSVPRASRVPARRVLRRVQY
jgi:hypothetical protein